MSKSIVIVCSLVASAIFLLDLVDARCKRHDYDCCRRRSGSGSCHRHERRWAYNASCGRCQQFEYSGCGFEDNNFERFEECSDCCSGARPCPSFTLPRPPHGCDYRWHDGPNHCRRPKLECNCRRSHCRPDACRSGQRCVPERIHECRECPCREYKCQTDPCFEVSRHLRPCERCVALPAPRCHHAPCPLIAHRESHCGAEHYRRNSREFYEHNRPELYHHNRPEFFRHERPEFFRNELEVVRLEPEFNHRRHCPNFVECPREGRFCERRRCQAYPRARCIHDPCDCRKHWWDYEGRSLRDEECLNVLYG